MVFEEQVAYYLDRYLGKFVKGLSKEALKISVWAGNVELTNMQLKPEALNALKLPVKVKAGFLGSVKLKVPWSRLGQEPVIVSLDRIFLLAEPATNVDGGDGGDAVQEAKMNRVKEAERKLVEARGDAAMKEEANNSSWLGSLVTTIIGNLKLSISNIHIRYEDTESHPGHPFSAGLMLEKLAAVTVDENGKETFVTGGSLDRIQKASELQRLSVYFDPDTHPWKPPKKWEELLPNDWAQIFVPGIKAESSYEGRPENLVDSAHSYILQPVGGHARYYKFATKDQRSPESPAQRANVILDDVTIGLSEGQYRDVLKLVENFSTFNKRLQYAHYRPSVPITEDKRAWWQYAVKAVAEQHKRASGHVSWKRVVKLSEMRKTYLPLYVSCLQSGSPDRISVDDNKEVKVMDRELDTDVIIQWRMMAHTFVDKNRAEDQKRQQQKQGWWPFGWGGQSSENDKEANFTEGDWDELNRLIGYDEAQKSNLMLGQDPPNMLNMLLEVHMGHNATKLVANDKEELLDVSSDDLHCVLHMYPKTIRFDLKLDSYQVACPDGLLAESATKSQAVHATFTYLPSELDVDAKMGNGQSLDWSLAAKASPIYATVLMKSINKIVKFFQSSKAVSRSVALDTATALQTTFDEVARNAQQQINHALKDRPRFSIDLDLAAPKITIPSDFYPDGSNQCKLLVDLGYFSLQTESDDKSSESAEENELYMRFRLRLADVSATLVDGDHDWKDDGKISGTFTGRNGDKKGPQYLSVLEKCAMLVAFQQICVPHPLYPTTRVALRLPSLGFQFSPARYHRLMKISKTFQTSSDDDGEDEVHPWEPSDFEGNVSVLAWKGVGNREAVWQHRHAALTGPFLYLLETPNAQTYKYCSSLIGKQVSEVPPDAVGNIPFVLAVCDAGQFNNKVAVSVNALLLRFEDNSSMLSWQGRLAAAIYRASGPAAIAALADSESQDGDASVTSSEANERLNRAEQESLFVIGVLDELKIVISDSQLENHTSVQILREPESPLLEFRAIGTKVEVAVRTYHMSVGAVLQALEIEDKFYGHVSPSCKYLARSYIKNSANSGIPRSNGKKPGYQVTLNKRKPAKGSSKHAATQMHRNESDRFFDAEEDLNSEDLQVRHRTSSSSISKFFDAEEGGTEDIPTFAKTSGLLPMTNVSGNARQDEAHGNFVKVQVVVFSQDSPDYANIDKKVTVTLATLSFFSNRRTLLALLDLVAAIGADVEPKDSSPEETSDDRDAMVSTINPKTMGDEDVDDETSAFFSRNDSVLKGLLGTGKSRVVFLVVLDMDRTQIVLNTEDGAQLSVLTLADLHTEVKVFPSSFGIKAALGNLRISDGSLNEDHPYHYICNMRDPNGASFIELEFLSFNKEDDDYEGFEYSIMGKLSEVRIVFLNRFVQEIIGYLMGLVPRSAGYVVKLKDRVTEVEKLINQSEIEGQPAMKLGLSLDKPVFIMPRSTSSSDFLELDILHINLFNSFQWLGGEKDELGAVRLETTTLELEDLHLVVGVNGKTGEGIIQEARGLALTVRRPIRDLWHQLPAVEAAIKIKDFRAALSDKEYQVITECAVSNMAETPNLPPPVIESPPDDDADDDGKVEDQRQVDTAVPDTSNGEGSGREDSAKEAWTTIKVGVGIEMVALGLFTGQSREAALAEVQVTGVWASYKSNTLQESNIQATLEKFSVRDDREGTQSEMRYMIGNAEDGDGGGSPNAAHEEKGAERPQKAVEKQGSCTRPDCKSALTMLVMDAKISPTLQMVSLRIQRPQLLVALDFLLAVAEFFVPSMHAMLSDGKSDGENPMEVQNATFLRDPVHYQSAKEVILSPKTPLVADVDGIDTFIYDGKAGYIRLLDRDGADLRDFSKEVIILIGDGKKLIFKNVVIQNGDFLDSCVAMGNNSSYTASENDGVFLEGQPERPADDGPFPKAAPAPAPAERAPAAGRPAPELVFDLQAVSPELTFYDSMNKGSSESALLVERLLRVRMNVFARVVLKGADMEVNAQVNSLGVETGGGVRVMEPVDMKLEYSSISGKQAVSAAASEVFTNFSFSTIQLILRLQTDVMSFLRITSEQAAVECSQFDKVWQDDDETDGANCITFWRPRAPPGFAVLGDCMTPRDELPSKGVLAVNMSLARVRRPRNFVCLWSSDQAEPSSPDDDDDDDDEKPDVCSVWLPVPPPGYVALGCVACPGKRAPPLNTCFCVMAPLVTRCGMRDCIIISSGGAGKRQWSFWRVDNSSGSFFLLSDADPQKYVPHELRQVLSNYDSLPVQETRPPVIERGPAREPPPPEQQQQQQQQQQRALSTGERTLPFHSLISGRFYENVARFNLVWWDKNCGSRKGVSVWRPVVPNDCVILGDVAVEGYEPPSMGWVLRDTEDLGLLSKPLRYQERGAISPKRKRGGVSFWLPVAPPGYVPLGCIATTGAGPDADDCHVRCVREDLVIGSNYSASSLWRTSDIKYKKQDLGLWQVENEASTFIVGRGFKHPPTRLALSLADLKRPTAPDNLKVNAEFKQISVTVSDDFGGLMAPLLDVSVSGIKLDVHGRMEAMSSTVNFSFAAVTFNGKNGAWEPLIEPWDGVVRFEYSSYPADKTRPSEARLRLTASTELNINVSTANLNILLEAYASWNRLDRMEENSKKQFSIDSRGRMNKPVISSKNRRALSCANHNELGEDLFLRITERNHTSIMPLPSGGTAEVMLPSAQRMQLPGINASRTRRSEKTVAIRIGEAMVPVDEGIGGREFMSTVRVIPLRQTSGQQEKQYQSARTRCVPPDDPDDDSSEPFTIHWDEVFIFEVDSQAETVAEVVVVDLGKGVPVGYCKVDLREDSENSPHIGSGPKTGAHVPLNLLVLEWQSLYKPPSSEGSEIEATEPCGKVSIAKYFYSKVSAMKREEDHAQDLIQIGPTPNGPWSPMGLSYTLGSAPWTVHDDVVASEFYIEDGVKHVVMRSLVSVENGTDFDLEVSLCMISTLRKLSAAQESENDDDIGETVEDEYFENERYQPLVGWGSKWPGHLLPTDPGRYTNRELTSPSKEVPDVKLPLGWEWTSDWHVDKVGGGDENGWAYGFDFRSIEWPPAQRSEQLHSFVRRRRWIRARQSIAKGGRRVRLGVLGSGSKLSLPAACLRQSSANYSLQVRPTAASHGLPYEWSQVVPYKGLHAGRKQPAIKEISVRSLFETEQLLSCAAEAASSTSSSPAAQPKDVWFCLEASSVVIGKDDQMDPVKEWKVMITASIMLRNYLPVPCEYSVSEKATRKRLLVRDRGVIKPGDAAGIFHIDLRKPTYLTWLPQGGWNPKKETVLISHPYREPADHITYSNARTSRSLEVMIEHDEEEKGVAAKVLQFYVPCWLDSAKCPPLQYRLMEILQRGDTKDEDDVPERVQFEGVKLGNVTEEVNFEERNDYPTMLSDMDPKTMGLSVAINRGDRVHFGPVSPLLPLENPDGYMELRGLAESGSFFRFLVSAASCPLQFAKTKVIRIRPYILFTNRLGEALHLKQKDVEDSRTLGAADWRVSFSFSAADDPENLQIKLDGYEWSCPFALEKETSIVVPLHKTTGEQKFIKVDIRGYEEGSRFSIMFRLGSARGPYRLENRTASSKLKFRQAGLDDDSWQLLKPHTTKTFAWENPQGDPILEVVPAEANHSDLVQYEIDKIGDHSELRSGLESGPNICVRVLELLEIKTVRFFNKLVEDDSSEDEEIETVETDEEAMMISARDERMEAVASSQVELVISIWKFGLSVTDQHPREILYLSLDNVVTTYQIGFGERTTRFKLRIGNVQLDNQLPLAWMPVLFAPERRDESKEFLVKVSIVMYDDKAEAREVYHYVGVQVESAFRINVHEPIIWAVVDMFNNVHLDRLSEDSAVVQVDPEIRIELIDLSEVRLKLTLETAAGARPRGMLGIWSPLVTTLGNTNKMPIRLGSVFRRDRYMRKSAVSGAITNRIRRDLIHQPLQLLTGVDVLGMTSSTLGTLSQGAAELSKDEKYLRMRSSKDRSRYVAGVGDGLLQGTEALARGVGYGLTGVVTKPISSARQHGFIGFFQGVGKAAVGFVILPVSGILDFVSLTVNGVGATCISCFEIFERDRTLNRRRLPRAIRGNSVLCPYNPDESAGQAILQLAQSTSFIGFKGVFTEQAKFAWSDFYEAHFELPKNKILMLTNRRILLLGRPKSHMQNPAKTFSDPSTILWEVTWRNLLALEIKPYESSLILHLRISSVTFAQVVKCHPGNVPESANSHAYQAFSALQRVWKEYGPDRKTVLSEISRKGKHQSGRLTLRPRSKRTENVADEDFQERLSFESSSTNRDSASSFTSEVVLFEQIWSSEREATGSCCNPKSSSESCTIWRPNAPDGYVSVGDIARIGSDPPPVSVTYKNEKDHFALPMSYTLLWRNWKDGFCAPVSLWIPKPPDGYVAVGCVAVADYVEPAPDAVWCVREDLTEIAALEPTEVWHATAPWHCYIFPLACESLSFIASRQQKQDSTRRFRKVKLPDGSHQT